MKKFFCVCLLILLLSFRIYAQLELWTEPILHGDVATGLSEIDSLTADYPSLVPAMGQWLLDNIAYSRGSRSRDMTLFLRRLYEQSLDTSYAGDMTLLLLENLERIDDYGLKTRVIHYAQETGIDLSLIVPDETLRLVTVFELKGRQPGMSEEADALIAGMTDYAWQDHLVLLESLYECFPSRDRYIIVRRIFSYK